MRRSVVTLALSIVACGAPAPPTAAPEPQAEADVPNEPVVAPAPAAPDSDEGREADPEPTADMARTIAPLNAEVIAGDCALGDPVVVDTAPRGRFVPVELAARPEGALLAWAAPDGHVRARPITADGTPRGEVVDTGLPAPADRYATGARDAGFFLQVAPGGYVIASHAREGRQRHVLHLRALDVDGRPRGEPVELTTARQAHWYEIRFAPAPDGLWLLRPPNATLTRLRVTDEGLESTDVTTTELAVPVALIGEGDAVAALLRLRDGSRVLRVGSGRPVRVTGGPRGGWRLLAAERTGDRVDLPVRVRARGGGRATATATLRGGRFTLGERLGRDDPVPPPFAARALVPTFEEHPGYEDRYPAPVHRTLRIIDAAHRRVRAPIDLPYRDFWVSTTWTGRAVLVASGSLREVHVQTLRCTSPSAARP